MHHYELILSGEGGDVARLSLPPSSREGRFFHLRAGARYRVEARAWGNLGGTAPDTWLNRTVPCGATIDFSGVQDLSDFQSVRLVPVLDPVPFEGTAIVVMQNLPAWAKSLDLVLSENEATRFTGTFPPGKIRLSSLRAGLQYRVRVTALGKNRSLSAEQTLFFDPSLPEIEQAATVSLGF